VLAVGGAIAIALGALMLFQAGTVQVALPVVATGTAVTVVFFLGVIGAGLAARRLPVTTGAAGMLGLHGVVVERLAPAGRVRVGNELWNARADAALENGSAVEVVQVQGMLLRVRSIRQEG
jgi:membrane-bound serine protease (ClpP class)